MMLSVSSLLASLSTAELSAIPTLAPVLVARC